MFGREVAYKWVVAVVYVAALFLDILDTTIVNVALIKMGQDFRTDAVEWVVLGYTLSLAVWIPTSGWLGDRFGTKKVFLVALAAFTFGSAACGFSQSIGQLIAFRVLQGVGGGMLTPTGSGVCSRKLCAMSPTPSTMRVTSGESAVAAAAATGRICDPREFLN